MTIIDCGAEAATTTRLDAFFFSDKFMSPLHFAVCKNLELLVRFYFKDKIYKTKVSQHIGELPI